MSMRRRLGHGGTIDDPSVAGWAQNGVSGYGNRGEATLGGSVTRSAREQGHQCCRTTPYSRPTARLQAVMVARSERCAPWAADGGRSTDKGFGVKTLKVFRSGRVMRSPRTLADAAPRRWRSRSGDLGGVPSRLAKTHIGASKLGTQISGPLRDDVGFSAGDVVTIETGGSSAYDPLGREGCW